MPARRSLLLTLLLVLPVATRPFAPARRAPAEAAELDQLFEALRTAPDETTAGRLEAQIRAAWDRAATPATLLLMARGQRDLQANAGAEAMEDFDDATALTPSYPDAWVGRARAASLMGDTAGAARDLQQALRLEPRHFGALLVLGGMQEQSGDLAGALRSLEAVLRIDPKMPGGEAKLRDLRRRALGDNT